jgi:hypothetical protein
MSERAAKYVAAAFAAMTALGSAIALIVDMRPLNTTAFAGATLVMVYFAANPKLLVTSRAEWQQVSRRATNARIAFVLGALLIIFGLIEAVMTSRAT